MKKYLLVILLMLVLTIPAYAAVGIKVRGTMAGAATDIDFEAPVTFDGSTATAYLLGFESTAASTTVASGTAVIPVTGYDIVVKNISEKAGSVATVANGKPGKVLKIIAGTLTGSDTLIITPATSTGFTTVTFTAAKQAVTLLYLNDTLGWMSIGTDNNPTVA
jgi:hypothetical protein